MSVVNPDAVNLSEAERVIDTAAVRIKSALKEHGHTGLSFMMIAELWNVYIRHVQMVKGKPELEGHHVAQMMALLKSVRSVYGSSDDNFVDQIGYVSLAAMLTAEAELGRK